VKERDNPPSGDGDSLRRHNPPEPRFGLDPDTSPPEVAGQAGEGLVTEGEDGLTAEGLRETPGAVKCRGLGGRPVGRRPDADEIPTSD
jgi:hypothetical protein